MKFDFYTGGAVWRLLDAVCKEVAAPTWDADAFERVRDRLVRALRNVDKARADSHSSRWRRELCDEGRPPVGDVRDAVGAITIEDVRAHASRALKGCRALLHVHGAVDESDVAAAEAVVDARFFVDDEQGPWPARRRLAAPAVNEPLRVARFSPNAKNDKDSAVLKCYDLGPKKDVRTHATASLLVHVAKEPFFTQLRTREQLGYLVSMSYSSARGRLLLLLRVQSQRVCADDAAARVEAFLDAWRPDFDGADFDAAKAALAKKWREPATSMASEAAQAWGCLLAPDSDGAPSFDRPERVAAAVAKPGVERQPVVFAHEPVRLRGANFFFDGRFNPSQGVDAYPFAVGDGAGDDAAALCAHATLVHGVHPPGRLALQQTPSLLLQRLDDELLGVRQGPHDGIRGVLLGGDGVALRLPAVRAAPVGALAFGGDGPSALLLHRGEFIALALLLGGGFLLRGE